jgi:DNA-binding response OmpR family regulator
VSKKEVVKIGSCQKKLNDQPEKQRILLVDDELDNSSIFKIALEDNGYLDSYNDPESALSVFKLDYYDLLLLDIKMPKMDGYELYEKLRKVDNKVKVCFLTASERYREEHRPSFLSSDSTSSSNDFFLIKPITIDDLVKKVNGMIKQK